MAPENIEVTVARQDERLKSLAEALVEIAKDQKRMAESYEKLVENNHRLALLEAEVVSMKEGQKILWQKYDSMAAASAATTQKWLWEFGKVIIAAAGAVVAARMFGAH